MRTLTVYVDGIGLWAPGIEDWSALQRVLSAGDIASPDANAKPAPAILPPTERRRAPDAVLLVAYDIVARGPLAEVAPSGVPFAVAFVLSPSRGTASIAALSIYPLQGAAKSPPLPDVVAAFATNPTAVQALPLLFALAQ